GPRSTRPGAGPGRPGAGRRRPGGPAGERGRDLARLDRRPARIVTAALSLCLAGPALAQTKPEIRFSPDPIHFGLLASSVALVVDNVPSQPSRGVKGFHVIVAFDAALLTFVTAVPDPDLVSAWGGTSNIGINVAVAS